VRGGKNYAPQAVRGHRDAGRLMLPARVSRHANRRLHFVLPYYLPRAALRPPRPARCRAARSTRVRSVGQDARTVRRSFSARSARHSFAFFLSGTWHVILLPAAFSSLARKRRLRGASLREACARAAPRRAPCHAQAPCSALQRRACRMFSSGLFQRLSEVTAPRIDARGWRDMRGEAAQAAESVQELGMAEEEPERIE